MHPTRIRLTTAVIALTLLTAACSNDATNAGPAVDLGRVELVAALQPFDKCDDFLSYVKAEAAKQVTAYGLGGSGGGVIAYDSASPVTSAVGMTEDRAIPSAAPAGAGQSAPEAKGAGADSAAGTDTGTANGTATGTNNQETDVDEADIVKTDGNRVVTLRNNELIIVTLVDGLPRLTTRLSLGDDVAGNQLFLLPDRAYVLGTTNQAPDAGQTSTPYVQQATIVEVSLTGDPAVAHRASIDGYILDGRLANGALRLVLSSAGGGQLGFVYPSGDGTKSIDAALAANKAIIDESTLTDWLPSHSIDGAQGAPLLDCDHLYRPAELSGFSMMSILTISDGLDSLTGTGLLADGQTTYASTDHLYVATNRWNDPSGAVPDGGIAKRRASAVAEHTDVHSFSIAGSDPAVYEASGRVEGHVLNQYSMSEADNDLRIATTVGPTFGIVEPMPECPPDADCAVPGAVSDSSSTQTGDSRIVVLRREGDALKEIGKVGGLGAGEQIKSVRYVGNTAYVVTFRQTDPFYVVDLTDPTSPKTLGELKVPGFSSYLHPVGDHLVLGVGSAATDQGRITGAKLSLYDTTDPVSPKEITSWTAKDLSFQVDNDPHAFSWDADRTTAYLPYYGTCTGDGYCGQLESGVLVVKVADGKITELGRITHADRTPTPDAPPAEPSTTTPETTSPDTTVPEQTTTVPEETTTVPETTTTTSIDGVAPAIGSTPPVGVAPMPTEPYCDPAACDPTPYAYVPTITRVFVIGDRVITLSDAGIAAHDVTTLKPVGFVAF